MKSRATFSCRPNFFLHVRVLSHLFRRLFLQSLQHAFDSGKLQFFNALEYLRERLTFQLLDRMKACEWVVYAKRPFAGPQQVLDSVGRYTHRVAISNHRLLDIENDEPLSVEGLSSGRPNQDDDLVGPTSSSGVSCCMCYRMDCNASATTVS